MQARTAPPVGYYVVEIERGKFVPYHRLDDMLTLDSERLPGALVPIGPSQSKYIRAVRFCYERAGVPWENRKRVAKRGAPSQAPTEDDASEGEVSPANAGGILPVTMAKRKSKRTA